MDKKRKRAAKLYIKRFLIINKKGCGAMYKNKKKIILLFSFIFLSGSNLFSTQIFPKENFPLQEYEIRPGAGRVLSSESRNKILHSIREVIESSTSSTCFSQELLESFDISSFQFKRYTGNWGNLENELRGKGEKTLLILGFGSLLDSNLSNEFHNRQEPALAFGVRRFFGFKPPSPEKSTLGMPEQPYDKEQLRLTTRLTKSPSDITNGVLLQIDLDTEMEDFREREKGYDLVKVPILKIKNTKEGSAYFEISEAFILTEPEEEDFDKENNSLHTFSPHMSYLYVCLRGARSVSETWLKDKCFLDLFIKTTYLSDEKTPVEDWVYDVIDSNQPTLTLSYRGR